MTKDRLTTERWAQNLLDVAERVASVEYQRKAWFERSLAGVYDDPVECKLQTFDDVRIEEFLRFYARALRSEVHKALAAFCATYDAYPFAAFGANFRLDDPKWLKVVQSAQQFLAALKKHGWFKPVPVPDPQTRVQDSKKPER